MRTVCRLTIASFILAALNLSAQTSAGLDIQMYAGLTITGTVGTVYSVDYITDLAQANDASAWRCLEFLRLPPVPTCGPISRAGNGEAILPGGPDGSADEHGVHPARYVPDGKPDERSGPGRR